jgi:hypothetical protein
MTSSPPPNATTATVGPINATAPMMCHYAILEETDARDATVWLEPVTDEQYTAADATADGR